MGKYGDVAELAVEICRQKRTSPPEAWAEAAEAIFPLSESSQKKGCPKGAFLGLAAAGLIRGVPSGDYGRGSSGKNASYAVAAAEIIRKDGAASSRGTDALWLMSLEKVGAEMDKKPNSQMEVVLALHELGVLL